jgi:IS5 family transposase
MVKLQDRAISLSESCSLGGGMVQESREEVNLFEHHRLLRDLIDMEHPLVKLAESIDWESLEEELKEAYPSTTGHPNKPIRLMVGLHYLRYMFNLTENDPRL